DYEFEFPNWSFDRVFIIPNEDEELSIRINSIDGRKQLQASIEKPGAFQSVNRYNEQHPHVQTYIEVPFGMGPIYIPETVENMTKKTLVANQLKPELFINALFSNPSLVKPNQHEAFFTDGQRGMRIFQGGRYLEFIHPIETNEDKLEAVDLIDKSINHINGHKGWINEYHLESVHSTNGKVEYRLHYDGVPVFDFNNLSVIEQIWREQDLYQYRRSLLQIGHLLNVTDLTLPESDEVIRALQVTDDYALDKITDIRIGYYLNYIDEVHSLTLEPTWFMRYENSWIRIPMMQNETNNEGIRSD